MNPKADLRWRPAARLLKHVAVENWAMPTISAFFRVARACRGRTAFLLIRSSRYL